MNIGRAPRNGFIGSAYGSDVHVKRFEKEYVFSTLYDHTRHYAILGNLAMHPPRGDESPVRVGDARVP